jgi:hypothetical protein
MSPLFTSASKPSASTSAREDRPRRRLKAPYVLNALLLALATGWSAPSNWAAEEETIDDPAVVLEDDSGAADGTGGTAEVPVDFKQVLAAEGYRFNGTVLDAYVKAQKQKAMAELKAMGKALPAEFLNWVDGEPTVRATVYGSPKPAHVLLMLYSLSQDVGSPRFKRYRNWLLAAAVKNANHGPKANITPRPPLKLVIPGDPRRPVNTKDPNRKLDQNDHIINFLEDGKLVASDVMYKPELQSKFNAYMASKGMPARVNCSMKLGTGTPAQKRPAFQKVMDAYGLFQRAYEEKGRIPKQKEPRIGVAEWVVLQVNNHESGASRSKYPLDKAPWPVLTALLNPRLSLREAYELNHHGVRVIPGNRYELNAFNTAMLKAVDVRPFPYAEGTWFMIKKHGGACGTRAMLAANQNKAYGLPSAPVGEIGHASWVEFLYFSKGNRYGMRFKGGGQNPAVLSIHLPLPISRGRAQERGSNWGAFLNATQNDPAVRSYMESMMAYYTLQALTPAERAKYGAQLKADALKLNAGNILLSGVMEKNTSESIAERKQARWRKNHAGELLRQQRGRG